MKLHPIRIDSYTSFEDLGRQIAGLRYDLMAEVLTGMLQEVNRQKTNDEETGHVKLAFRLNDTSAGIENALEGCHEVMRICRPHIEAEKAERERIRQEQLNTPWPPKVMVRP